MRVLFLIALLVPSLAFAAIKPATSKQVAGSGLAIVAVVNDEVITSYDLEQRIAFVLATTKLSATPEVLDKVRPQVLRTLIDERLHLQEAALQNIKVADDEIPRAIASIEAERGMKAGSILAGLKEKRVPKETFEEQIRAQIAWGKIVSKLRSRVKISEEEVTLGMQTYVPESITQEVEMAVLLMPVDKPEREQELGKLAEKLVSEVRAGADFEEVSRQFSGSASQKNERFWIALSQMDPSLAQALSKAKAGMVLGPVRSQEGFRIIKIYDVRGTTADAKPDPEQTRARLFQQKLELEAQKTMRNLRRDAFVEVRLGKPAG